MVVKVRSWRHSFSYKGLKGKYSNLLSPHVILWPDKIKVWERQRPQLNIYCPALGFHSSVLVTQTWISKCHLPSVKSVRPASNQNLHPKANVMWQLSNHAACHRNILLGKHSILCSQLFLASPLRNGNIYTTCRSGLCSDKYMDRDFCF